MRTFIAGTVGGLAALGLLGTASADVIVRLDSGTEVRAVRAWKDGDVVRVAFRTGVASFPASSVVAIEETTSAAPLPRETGTSSAGVGAAPRHVGAARTSDKTAAAAPAADHAAAAKGPATGVDESVPDVKGEDSQTRLDRLDALSMQTHRQLSVARTNGEPQEKLDALQRKIDTINEKRGETMKRLGK